MKISNKGLDLIKKFEGLHDGDLTAIGLQPKLDPVGIWTEGYGHAMRDGSGNFIKGASNKALADKFRVIKTEADALAWLDKDLDVFEAIVSKKVHIEINQNQFDALVSHTYNTGGSNTLFDLINQRRPKEDIYKWFTEKYTTAQGVKLRGLVNRRKEEADLFFS
jgi:lysozyme